MYKNVDLRNEDKPVSMTEVNRQSGAAFARVEPGKPVLVTKRGIRRYLIVDIHDLEVTGNA